MEQNKIINTMPSHGDIVEIKERKIYTITSYGDIVEIKEEEIKQQHPDAIITTNLLEAINDAIDIKVNKLK